MNKAVAFLAMTIGLVACASIAPKEPYATIDDSWNPVSRKDSVAATIVGLDGKMFVRARPLQLTPGFHTVLVQSSRSSGRHAAEPPMLTLYINAKACTAYYVTAQHKCSVCRDWEPAIVLTEPIPGCNPNPAAALDSSVPPASE